mmetsp:Transcript_20549/g.56450  ORF Transcript_20549/g.56450 Transcript_20549/m.56450 type:complete len:163 (-) Transcript_20549:1405-1893(-)|eukprot:scaffold33786_cov32-Tisochrysis_lutea.AAC.9
MVCGGVRHEHHNTTGCCTLLWSESRPSSSMPTRQMAVASIDPTSWRWELLTFYFILLSIKMYKGWRNVAKVATLSLESDVATIYDKLEQMVPMIGSNRLEATFQQARRWSLAHITGIGGAHAHATGVARMSARTTDVNTMICSMTAPTLMGAPHVTSCLHVT